jgi:hypothetical protein
MPLFFKNLNMNNNKELIEIILKVLQLQDDSESGSPLSHLNESQFKGLLESLNVRLANVEKAFEGLSELLLRIDRLENERYTDNTREAFISAAKRVESVIKDDAQGFVGSDSDIDKPKQTLGEGPLKELKKVLSARSKAQLGVKRGSYKKRKSKEEGTVVLQHGPPTTDNGSNVFGAKTTSKYNKAISRALNSVRFTPKEIIAEVRAKHAKVHRFPGKELVHQVRKAKWRLDSRRRAERNKDA